MATLLDSLFRFPPDAVLTTKRVESILDLIDLPVGVMDKRFHTQFLNASARRMLASQGITVGDRKKGSSYNRSRSMLKPVVTDALRSGRTVILRDVETPIEIEGGLDLAVCPGRIQRSDLAFIVALPGAAGLTEERILARLLDAFTVGAVLFGPDLRHRYVNVRGLAVFGLKPGETIGRMTSEINPSPQGKVLDGQLKQLLETRRGRFEESYPIASARFGVIRSRLSVWPIWSGQGTPEGMVVLVDPLPAQALAPEPDDATLTVLGRDAFSHGPPVFHTHIDGTVSLANAAAKALIPEGTAGRPANIKTDLKWTNPQIVGALFGSLTTGAPLASAMADLETPSGVRTMKITARGIRDVGTIVSQVSFVLTDATESETTRRLLSDTVRSLAGEKEVLDRMADALDLPVVIVDENLAVVRINNAIARRLKISPDEAVGKPISQVIPTAEQTGMAGMMRSVIESGEAVYIRRFEHIMKDGRVMPMEGALYPIKIEGRSCCLAVSRETLKEERLEANAARWESLYRAAVANVREGVFVVDNKGIVVELNEVVAKPRGGRERAVGTLGAVYLAGLWEGDVILAAQQKAAHTGKPQHMGLMRVTRRDTGEEHFVEITHVPLKDAAGAPAGVMSVIYFATGMVDLGRQITKHTEDLQRTVREQTAEVVEANRALSDTVAKISAIAESGLTMASLEVPETAYRYFLNQAMEVLGASSVNLMVTDGQGAGARTSYFSAGKGPAEGTLGFRAFESAMAGLAQGGGTGRAVSIPRPNTLLAEIDLGGSHALLVAWKSQGEFGGIESGLAGLLAAQMALAVPIARYLRDLKQGRDKAECLRRIAVRVGGAGSAEESLRMLAEEIAGVLPVDRVVWIVEGGSDGYWVREVFDRSGRPAADPRRLAGDRSRADRLQALASARGKSFCDGAAILARGPDGAGGGGAGSAAGGGAAAGATGGCPFVARGQESPLVLSLRQMFQADDHLRDCCGGLLVAPVGGTEGSHGLLCALSADGQTLKPDDACFICVASSTVACMLRAADAAGAIRRLEATGETVGDIVHDLKYPLLKMREDLVRLQGAGGAAAEKDALSGLLAEVGNVAMLADELAEVADPRSRSPEALDLARVLDRCLGLIKDNLRAAGIEVTKDVEGRPPVFADKRDVTRVVLNILSNGVEAVAANGTIGISARVAGTSDGRRMVELVFEDSGPGVPESHVHKVFEAFFTTKQGGTGLGLFSARKRAQANGGGLICEIGPEGKSRFVLTLPAVAGQDYRPGTDSGGR